MEKQLFAALVASLGFATACGSSRAPHSGDEPSPSVAPECVAGFVCGVKGLPFVKAALPSTDAWGPGEPAPGPGETTATVTQPESGELCMAGHLEQGWGYLTLLFGSIDSNGWWYDTLDATALGIASIEFALDSPPEDGLAVQLVSAVPGCKLSPLECQHWGFFLNEGDPPVPFVTNQATVVHAPVAGFVREPYVDPSWEFDPSHLTTLQIGAGAFDAVSGDYDFCVHDLTFLNADGVAVLPPT